MSLIENKNRLLLSRMIYTKFLYGSRVVTTRPMQNELFCPSPMFYHHSTRRSSTQRRYFMQYTKSSEAHGVIAAEKHHSPQKIRLLIPFPPCSMRSRGCWHGYLPFQNRKIGELTHSRRNLELAACPRACFNHSHENGGLNAISLVNPRWHDLYQIHYQCLECSYQSIWSGLLTVVHHKETSQ